MENFSQRIVKAEDSKLITFKTTEKIGNKYFFKYLITQLKLQNIYILNSTYLYSSFNEEKSFYKVIILNSPSDKFIFEPLILKAYYYNHPQKSLKVDVFICDTFFAVFNNKKLFSFKKFKLDNPPSNEDIKLFISQSYSWKVTNIINISKDKFEQLKLEYTNKDKYSKEFNSSKDSKKVKSLSLFTLFVFSIFSYFIFLDILNLHEKSKITVKNSSTSKPKIYKNKSYENMMSILSDIKSYDIKVESLSYLKNSYSLDLNHPNKEVLLKFVNNSKVKNTTILSLVLDQTKAQYSLKVDIHND